jgi:hypothetical protein
MDGYRYMIERNRLMQKLEDDLARLAGMPEEQRQAETRRLEADFDRSLAALYAEVATEFPGERRKKARPMADPH